MSLFASIIITITLSYVIIRIYSPSSILEFPQKYQAFDFLKRNCYTNVCLKFFCDAKLITQLLIFLILNIKFEVKTRFGEGKISVKNLGFFFQSSCLRTNLPAEAVAMK